MSAVTPRALVLAVALAALAGPAAAQDRPSEDELFGAPPRDLPAPPAGAEQERGDRAAPEKSDRPEEAQLFGAPPAAQAAPPPPQRLADREREDALAVGGQLYLRARTAFQEDVAAGDAAFSSPNLLDVYLDARPNDRVRGFALGRLSYDPTLAPAAAAAGGLGGLFEAFSGESTFVPPGGANPDVVLDQLWVNFDVERRVFVTAGRQHAKWGVGRFWNPTDYLHPVRRDPLAVFDVRTGTTMLKLHAPWEARGWNAYAVAILEDVAGDAALAANRLGRVGVGARAEIVLGPMELGLDAVAQDGHRPRFGVDVSAGVWDLDVYAEAAIRTSVDTPRWREVPDAAPGADLLDRFERRDRLGPTAQVVVGGSYGVKYSDEDAVTFGAEYFYDRSGYESPRIYPVLLGAGALAAAPASFDVQGLGTFENPFAGQPNPFTPFYLGRHYAGAFASLPAPGPWNDTTLTLSVLGNLSDKSFVARLDHSMLALTYLRVETFVAGHFGAREGEFRLGFDVSGTLGGIPVTLRTDPQIFEAGIAVRVSL